MSFFPAAAVVVFLSTTPAALSTSFPTRSSVPFAPAEALGVETAAFVVAFVASSVAFAAAGVSAAARVVSAVVLGVAFFVAAGMVLFVPAAVIFVAAGVGASDVSCHGLRISPNFFVGPTFSPNISFYATRRQELTLLFFPPPYLPALFYHPPPCSPPTRLQSQKVGRTGFINKKPHKFPFAAAAAFLKPSAGGKHSISPDPSVAREHLKCTGQHPIMSLFWGGVGG